MDWAIGFGRKDDSKFPGQELFYKLVGKWWDISELFNLGFILDKKD